MEMQIIVFVGLLGYLCRMAIDMREGVESK